VLAILAAVTVIGISLRVIFKSEKVFRDVSRQLRERRLPLHVRKSKIKDSGLGQALLSAMFARDIAYFNGSYYVATSGGLHVLNDNFSEEQILTPAHGLFEAQVIKLLPCGQELYWLYRNGRIGSLSDETVANYWIEEKPIRDIAVFNGRLLVATAEAVYEKEQDRLLEIVHWRGIKGICGGERLTIIGDDNRIYLATQPPEFLAGGDFQLVETVKEIAGVIYVASERGLYSSAERRFLFAGRYIKDFVEFAGHIAAITHDGEFLWNDRAERVTATDAIAYRLCAVNDRIFALSSSGLRVFDRQRWQAIALRSDLPFPAVTSVCGDPGDLWAGTMADGVMRLRHRRFVQSYGAGLEVNDSLVANRVPWFGTSKGIYRFQDQRLDRLAGTEIFYVNTLACQGDTLFAGTASGLLKISGSSRELFSRLQNLCNNRLFALNAVASEDVWCGTMGGLSFFARGHFSACLGSQNSAIKDNWISSIFNVSDQVYFTTFNGELGRIASSAAVEILDRRELKFNFNTAQVYRDFILLGTYGNGIYVFNRLSRASALFQKEIPSQNITDLVIHDGVLIAASDSGIWFARADDLLAELNL